MKMKYSLIATLVLCIAPLSTFAATLVDTGVPETQTANSAPYRGGKLTFTSNVQISAVQHYARVRTAGEITFTLRHDDAGLPGTQIYSAVTTLAVSTTAAWLGVDGLHWAVPAGTYWVTVEDHSGQLPTMLSRPIGLTDEPGTFPPAPLAAEANFFPPDLPWELGTGRTGWRVMGENAPGIYGVGDLPGGEFFSEIRDATKVNGVFKAVGNSASAEGSSFGDTGVLWSSNKGLVALPPVVAGEFPTFISGRDITADGTVIAGSARASATTSDRVAVLVTNNGTTNTVIGGSSSPRVISFANALSDDAAVAYGQGFQGGTVNEAFRWSEATGPVPLGFVTPGDDYSVPGARGTSSDGSVMVGVSAKLDEETGEFVPGNRAFRYVHGSGMTALQVPPGSTGTAAFAVTPNGTLVLGTSTSPAYPKGEFVRWNTILGTTEALGTPEPALTSRLVGALTADGQVVVVPLYDSDFIAPSKSYVRNAHGWFELNAVMAAAGADLTGWVLDQVWGVSPDVTLLYGAGQHDGHTEGWVSEVPSNYLRDYGAPLGDSTAPIITAMVSGVAGTNGWYRSSVSVAWNVTDADSAIGSTQGCGPANVTSDTSGFTISCTATSAGGTSTASVTIKRDTVAPSALVVSPLPGATYDRNQRVSAVYLCMDLRAGIAQCTGTVPVGQRLDTATKGAHSFTVNARDQAGNTRAVTVQYRVK
jgi:hypothetical protein